MLGDDGNYVVDLIGALIAAPAATANPAITGTPAIEQTLSADTGTWSGNPASYTYQWQDCDSAGNNCVDITGATASTYTLTGSDVGHTIRVVVTAHNAGGSTSQSSPQTSLVQALMPISTAAPAVSGTASVGHVLSCSTGAWTGSPTGYTYQWSRDGVPITGANGATYSIQSADQGHTLTCTVTASNASGRSARTSPGVTVAIANVMLCPRPTGKLTGTTLGPLQLGATRKQARRILPRFRVRNNHTDSFCLAPGFGIRVGYATVRLGSGAKHSQITGRIVLALTANPSYSMHGVRPGMRLIAAADRIHLGIAIRLGPNTWYVIPGHTANELLKVRHGIVREIGIATKQLTSTPGAQVRLLSNY